MSPINGTEVDMVVSTGADPERVDRVASHPPPSPLPQITINLNTD